VVRSNRIGSASTGAGKRHGAGGAIMQELIAWLFRCRHRRCDLWIEMTSGKSHWQCIDCHAIKDVDERLSNQIRAIIDKEQSCKS